MMNDPFVFPSLLTGAALFAIGMVGIVLRRNLVSVLMSIELMLTGVNLTLVTFSRTNQSLTGQLMVFFIVTVAAAEGAVGLGLLIAVFRNLREVSTEHLTKMKE